ncbi:MAG: BamA/TamA family outer membrane protein [Acidobacteriota bacterium]
MRAHVLRLIVALLVALWWGGQRAEAQETRDEARAAAQAEKAKALTPYTPTLWERRIERAGRVFTQPASVYVFAGSVFRGGSFALGPGYRTRFGSSGTFDAHAAWSLRNFKFIGAEAQLSEFADRRVRISGHADWVDAPRLEYYGLGPQSPEESKTTFGYAATTAGLTARLQAAPRLAVGVGLDVQDITTDSGSKGRSIEERFDFRTAPGLGISPTYLRTQLFAEYDWRASPGYSTSGGRYRVDWFRYDDRDRGAHSFERVDLEVHQFVPVLRDNWIIALRALASFTTPDAGDVVPYFFLPSLGGSRELRGFPSWRFRDRHRLLLTGEYRWTAGRYVDMALFMDAGKVVADRDELDLRALTRTYGVGIRFHSPTVSVLRMDLARGRDGFRLAFTARPSF